MGRCGLDFRPLLPPIFQRAALLQFRRRVEAPVAEFQRTLPAMHLTMHALTAAKVVYEPPDFGRATKDGVQVPLSLTAHTALAQLANGLLLALNELREYVGMEADEEKGREGSQSIVKSLPFDTVATDQRPYCCFSFFPQKRRPKDCL